MDSHNSPQLMLRSPYMVPDPGNAMNILVDRQNQYVSLASAGTETRTLLGPPFPYAGVGQGPFGAGLTLTLGCKTYVGTITVTALDNTGATTGTITFSAAGQWVMLESIETSAGTFAWQITDVYGATTTIPSSSSQVALSVTSASIQSATITNLVVGVLSASSSNALSSYGALSVTNATINNQTASTILAGSVTATSASLAGVTATSISAAAGTANISNVACTNFSAASSAVLQSVTAPTMAISSVVGLSASVSNITCQTGNFTNLSGAGLTAQTITATQMSVPAFNATSATLGTCNVSSNLSAGSISAANVSVATGLTVLSSGNIASIVATQASINSVTANTISAASASAQSLLASTISASTLGAPALNATSISCAGTMTAAFITCSSNILANSISASNISAGNIIVATGITGGNLSAATGLTVGSTGRVNVVSCTGIIIGTSGRTDTAAYPYEAVTVAASGLAAQSSGQTLPTAPAILLSVTGQTGYFALPAPAAGLAVNIINIGASSALIQAATGAGSSNSVNNVSTGLALATKGASGSGRDLICDGTNWWLRNQ